MRRQITLRHRGYLYAQARGGPVVATRERRADGVTIEDVSAKRMRVAEHWRAGYLACMNDTRRKRE